MVFSYTCIMFFIIFSPPPISLSSPSSTLTNLLLLHGGWREEVPVCFIRLGYMSTGEACFQECGHFTSDYTSEENISPSPINYQVYINPQAREGGNLVSPSPFHDGLLTDPVLSRSCQCNHSCWSSRGQWLCCVWKLYSTPQSPPPPALPCFPSLLRCSLSSKGVIQASHLRLRLHQSLIPSTFTSYESWQPPLTTAEKRFSEQS